MRDRITRIRVPLSAVESRYPLGVDVLSAAITAIRLGRPSSDRVKMSGTWSVRLEPYEGAAFLAVMSGGCLLLPDVGEPVSLSAGDIILLLPHGSGHVIANSTVDPTLALSRAVPFREWYAVNEGMRIHDRAEREQTEVLCGKYRLDVGRLHPFLRAMPQVAHLSGRGRTWQDLQTVLVLLAREQQSMDQGSTIALQSLLDLLLLGIIRSVTDAFTTRVGEHAMSDPVTARAMEALHSHPARRWTNDRLAAVVGVSRPTLSRKFTSLVGRPPMAYLTWWRLVQAATLLRETDDTLASIADQVGYGSPYALSHAFLREFGATPGRYRLREQSPDAAA